MNQYKNNSAALIAGRLLKLTKDSLVTHLFINCMVYPTM